MATPSHSLEIWPQVVANALAKVTIPDVPSLSAMRGVSSKFSDARIGSGLGSETYRSAFRGLPHGKRRSERPDAPRSGRRTSSRRGKRWRRDRVTPLQLTPTCSNDVPGVAIVAHAGDLVAHMVSTMLRYDQIPVWEIDPHQLGAVEFDVTPGGLLIQGCPVRGLLLRSANCPTPDPDRAVTGQLCGDRSVTASWLAAASLGSIRVINSYDSDSWRNGAGWSVWERRLSSSGVPMPRDTRPDLEATQVSLLACGEVVTGEDTATIHAAGEVLQAAGVRLAAVVTADDGSVAGIDTQPHVSDAACARRAAVRVIDYVAA